MSTIFVAVNAHGPRWDANRPMEGQDGWDAHAAYMDALAGERFIVVGGPLEETSTAMLVIRAESREQVEARLAADPWRRDGTLVLERLSTWQIRLGSLP
jgi:uncharacterized protein YciI